MNTTNANDVRERRRVRPGALGLLASMMAMLSAFGCLSASAQGNLHVTIEPDTVELGQTCQLVVRASGGTVGEPHVPDIAGATVLRNSVSKSNQVSIVNLKATQEKIRWIPLRPERVGTITIPPVRVEIDGRVRESESITLTVTPRGQRQSSQSSAGTSSSPNAQSGGTTHDRDQPPLLMLEPEADKHEAYLNEPILLTLRSWEILHPRVNLRTREENAPSTEGFYRIPLERRASRRGELRERDGFEYRVIESYWMLYPTQTGELTIGEWHWTGVAEMGDLFFPERYRVDERSDPIRITVKPLPPAPPGFTGAVGQFEEVTAELSESQVVQGVPTALELQIVGYGNPNAIGQPELPETRGLNIDQPAPDVENVPDVDAPKFRKTFMFPVTAVEPGPLEIPPFDFVYFDPEKEEFVKRELGPFSLEAAPAGDSGPRVMVDSGMRPEQNRSIQVTSGDIRPWLIEPGALSPSNTAPWTVPAAVLLPPMAFAGLAAFLARRRRFSADRGLARGRRARATARKRLEGVSSAHEPAEALYRAIIGYVADKFDVSESGLTAGDVEALLDDRAINGHARDALGQILRSCERSRYASAPMDTSEAASMAQQACSAIDAIDENWDRPS